MPKARPAVTRAVGRKPRWETGSCSARWRPQSGLWDSCKGHPRSNEEHPFSRRFSFFPREDESGAMVFNNPLVSPRFPKFGIAFPHPAELSAEPPHPLSPGPCGHDPPAHRGRAARRKGAARVGFPIISKRSPYSGRRSVSPRAAGPHRVRPASARAALRNKFALCLGRSRQLLKSMSDQISAVADSLSLHIFMSVKKREARGS